MRFLKAFKSIELPRFEVMIFALTLVVIFGYGVIMGHAILGCPIGPVVGASIGAFVAIVATAIRLCKFKSRSEDQ